MKIAYLLTSFPVLSQTFVLNQITGLKDLGFDVDIFSAYQSNGCKVHEEVKKYRLLDHTVYYNTIPKNKIIRLLKAYRLVLSGLNKKPAVVFNSLNPFKYGRQAVNLNLLYKAIPFTRKKYDIIHCHFGLNGNIAIFFKELGAIEGKIVTTFHGFDIRLTEQNREIYRELFRKGDLFIAISSYNYDKLIELGADKNKIIYHPVGIDLEKFTPKENITEHQTEQFKLLTVARLVNEKGLHYAIKAIKRVKKIHPDIDIEYNIIGDGYLKKELDELIHNLQLQGCVKLLGAKEQDEIITFLRNSHIFILPSIAEALPVALMEAHAMELPIVATDVGSVKQIVLDGESGYVVKKGDDEALADKISLLLKNPEKLRDMGKAGRRHIEQHYNVRKLNSKLIQIFKNLLNKNRS